MIGDNIRIECWASGTSQPEPMIYSWEKVEYQLRPDGDKVILPMPPQAYTTDHNRCVTTRGSAGRSCRNSIVYMYCLFN